MDGFNFFYLSFNLLINSRKKCLCSEATCLQTSAITDKQLVLGKCTMSFIFILNKKTLVIFHTFQSGITSY